MGLVNYFGQAIPVFNIFTYASSEAKFEYIVVSNIDGNFFAFGVDTVDQVIKFDDQFAEQSKEDFNFIHSEFIGNVYLYNKEPLMMLNLEPLAA